MKTKKSAPAPALNPIVEGIDNISLLLQIAADAQKKADTLTKAGKKEVLHEKTGTTHMMSYRGVTIFIKPSTNYSPFYNVYLGVIGKRGKIIAGERLIKNSHINLDSIKHNLRFGWVKDDGSFIGMEEFSTKYSYYSW